MSRHSGDPAVEQDNPLDGKRLFERGGQVNRQIPFGGEAVTTETI
jgi:hypothetical protein